jgi:hypothetical protein
MIFSVGTGRNPYPRVGLLSGGNPFLQPENIAAFAASTSLLSQMRLWTLRLVSYSPIALTVRR